MNGTRTCSIAGCDTPRAAQGYCDTHYRKMRRRGLAVLPKRPLSVRLASHLAEAVGGCLEWTACSTPAGYGNIRNGASVVLAHRVAWELVNGPIPDGISVLHHCDNPPCCNVDHLFLGTHADNSADMISKGRGQGHPYDTVNTYRHGTRRHCRACRKANDTKRRLAISRQASRKS